MRRQPVGNSRGYRLPARPSRDGTTGAPYRRGRGPYPVVMTDAFELEIELGLAVLVEVEHIGESRAAAALGTDTQRGRLRQLLLGDDALDLDRGPFGHADAGRGRHRRGVGLGLAGWFDVCSFGGHFN